MRLLAGFMTALLGAIGVLTVAAVFIAVPVRAVQPVLPITKGGTGTNAIPNCPNALIYNSTTKVFGCNTTLSTMAPPTTTTTTTSTTTTTT